MLIALCALSVLPARADFGDRITVSGAEFRAGTNRIWINGVNTPWHTWNEFGGRFDGDWWDHHLQELHDQGINATRVWISCNGETGLRIDSSGRVLGCTAAFWRDVDKFFQIAQQRQVYIMTTLISFDHFSDSHTNYMSWRKMITSETNIDSMVSNYVAPFVRRYKDNPWLWSVDLCNEPDWIYENAKCGKIGWNWIQTYFARAAAAIHAESRVLVTVGISMGPKYNAGGAGTNVFGDAVLRSRAWGDSGARLDFYAPHHYNWMNRRWGNPFAMAPGSYGVDDSKPVVLAECPAKGLAGFSTLQNYEGAWRNGWQGVMAWTSNGVDKNGTLTDLSPATRAFRDQHGSLVWPGVATTPAAEPR
ncbi:MAG TPA: cellulase (glycosyl hydrolase family 5) [Verrucomicrobiae bacterium]|nr:cellulase (glycosyl hydrolase family 5) [Verrucomicrobiae bacterium]